MFFQVLFSGKMLEPDNYVASVEKGELTPQLTLSRFIDDENDWDLWEQAQILAMVKGP
jgi:hypothetical protein